ncbi:MAG: hypothetical protein WBX07_18275, partial [Rhodoplanes sp.]
MAMTDRRERYDGPPCEAAPCGRLLLKPGGRNQHHAARRDLAGEGDQAPRIKMKAEHGRAESRIAGQNVQKNLASGCGRAEQRRDDRHAI